MSQTETDTSQFGCVLSPAPFTCTCSAADEKLNAVRVVVLPRGCGIQRVKVVESAVREGLCSSV